MFSFVQAFRFLRPPATMNACAGHAKVAELVDALDLGSSAARRGGSSPPSRTIGFCLTPIPKISQEVF